MVFLTPGLNPLFYNILKEKEVSILLSSDAHVVSDIGRVFNQLRRYKRKLEFA